MGMGWLAGWELCTEVPHYVMMVSKVGGATHHVYRAQSARRAGLAQLGDM